MAILLCVLPFLGSCWQGLCASATACGPSLLFVLLWCVRMRFLATLMGSGGFSMQRALGMYACFGCEETLVLCFHPYLHRHALCAQFTQGGACALALVNHACHHMLSYCMLAITWLSPFRTRSEGVHYGVWTQICGSI
jgi:hypothetical protein